MKFNESIKEKNIIKNYEGEKAYKINPEIKLYSRVVTCLCKEKFYESSTKQITEITKLIEICKKEFLCKLAIYAREKMYLRSIPLFLIIQTLKYHKGEMLGKTIERIIQRADELTEIMACYKKYNNIKKLNKLSKQLKIGVAKAFNKFDEYQFSKYNRKTEIKIRDVMFLIHPKPIKEKEELFKKIANDCLKTPYTWEVEISTRGNKPEIWEELITSGKLGYMAMLRNLRNMIQAGVKNSVMQKVYDTLSNKERVIKSKQFPFRYLSAYKELQYVSMAENALESLEKAIIHSVENINYFDIDDKILIACDVSGSMNTPISRNSKVKYYDIGLILAMLLKNKIKNIIDTGIFGDIFKICNFPKSNVIQNAMSLRRIEGQVGYSTNGYEVIGYALKNKIEYDKIMIFTDCQMWDLRSSVNYFNKFWNYYKDQFPESKLYLFDLAGYGNTPVNINDKNVYFISGWSDKIFDMMEAIDNKKLIVKKIMGIKI